jgi:lysophospholipase L1-like esterase
MLGTNDANTINLQFKDKFVKDYTELIKQIQEIETKPKIFIVKPPPIYYQGSDINNTNLVNHIMPSIEQTANQLELPIIEVYEALSNHPEYFPDGVHPNNHGAKVIAQKIYQSIT